MCVLLAAHGGEAVEFRILGRLEVSRDGRPLVVASAHKPRLLLAAMLTRADQAVPADALIAALWGGRPPTSARRNLQLYVYQLRASLGADRVRAEGGGYRLVADGAVDATRFRAAVATGSRAWEAGAAEAAGRHLRVALDLWRGDAYSEFLDSGPVGEEATRLQHLRLTAAERWAETRLAIGGDARLVDELVGLCRQHPYRENLHALLIRALCQAGRRAEALDAYRRIRTVLSRELGIEPGAALADLHTAVLRGQDLGDCHPGAGVSLGRATPAQLPPAVAGFVGREGSSAALDAWLPHTASRPVTTSIAVVTGTAGVGKTALTLHWAHRVAPRFVDGQFYVDLKGFSPAGAPLDPAAALHGFLEALGTPADRIPADGPGRVGLYRSLMSRRRMLVVLDNARDAEQVKPLLPGSPGVMVVITSRNGLAGLVAAEGAHLLRLDVLDRAVARELLAARLGSERIAAESDAVEEIITRCAGLPLAVAVVAARAAAGPGFPLALLAEELRDAAGSLDAFAGGDVRAAFSWSVHAVQPAAARLFQLLGPHAGPCFDVPAAAGLACLSETRTRRLLAELSGAHLITEQSPGRFVWHELLRSYANELTATSTP